MHDEPIKPGYKRTEVGMIPEDWESEILRNCLQGVPQYGINAPAVPYDDKLPTYLRITDISDEGRFSPSPRVSVRSANSDRYYLNPGDIVFARTGASVGKSYLYDPDDGLLVFAGYLIRVIPNSRKLNPSFLAQYIQSDTYWDWVNMMSARSGQPGINGQEYGDLPIPLPGPTEQTAIAEVLSDVDALLEALDRLIAKKRAIKQGAMQALLTGRVRLPGFERQPGYKRTEVGVIPKDWDVVPLSSIALVTSGKRLPKGYSLTEQETPYPYIRVSDMRPGTVSLAEIKYVPEDVFPFIKNYRIYQDDIFISVAGTLGIVGQIPFELDGANLTENADRITNISCSQSFLLYIMMSPLIQTSIDSLQTVGAQPKLALTRIREFIIPLPPTKEEQTAIAGVLSDMDAEIEALEKRRAKLRAIKQGMMQELLTGRIRLVQPQKQAQEVNA